MTLWPILFCSHLHLCTRTNTKLNSSSLAHTQNPNTQSTKIRSIRTKNASSARAIPFHTDLRLVYLYTHEPDRKRLSFFWINEWSWIQNLAEWGKRGSVANETEKKNKSCREDIFFHNFHLSFANAEDDLVIKLEQIAKQDWKNQKKGMFTLKSVTKWFVRDGWDKMSSCFASLRSKRWRNDKKKRSFRLFNAFHLLDGSRSDSAQQQDLPKKPTRNNETQNRKKNIQKQWQSKWKMNCDVEDLKKAKRFDECEINYRSMFIHTPITFSSSSLSSRN